LTFTPAPVNKGEINALALKLQDMDYQRILSTQGLDRHLYYIHHYHYWVNRFR